MMKELFLTAVNTTLLFNFHCGEQIIAHLVWAEFCTSGVLPPNSRKKKCELTGPAWWGDLYSLRATTLFLFLFSFACRQFHLQFCWWKLPPMATTSLSKFICFSDTEQRLEETYAKSLLWIANLPLQRGHFPMTLQKAQLLHLTQDKMQ